MELFDTPDDDFDMEQEMKDERATELRAVYRQAYMAALGGMPRVGMESNINFSGLIKEAHNYALETIRQWPAMMAELEQEIAK